MKDKLYLLFIALLIIVILYLQYCTEPEKVIVVDEEKEKATLELLKQSHTRQDSITVEDSLKAVKIIAYEAEIRKLKQKTEERIGEIDIDIEIDSSQAIVKYRDGLMLLDIDPDNTLTLSNREMGWGSKFMVELHGSRLQLKINDGMFVTYRSRIMDKDNIIKEKDGQLFSKDVLLNISKQATGHFQGLYETTQKFTYHRFGIYMGAGVSYNGFTIEPALQIGIGILLWRNDEPIFGL